MIDGAKIRKLRNRKEWSQWDLAMRCGGIAQTVVSKIEANRDKDLNYTLKTARAMARALGVKVDDILFDD